ncbi:MFS transporter [Sinorhizobium meliloti]|jgi:MFS family permease|uniref:MFS transporter n=1 Tax=Rhizobium meliloti TaxID=382 RepID=UPI000D1DB561|nr:MFS transporter [Sinorhizobium meliloti]MDW9415897.1 MFS transporter [Sinorhizobium meliloti]MDW9480703.1 MFS transporter [Sinorhizobium meliloti]MDW9512243.1 MFS transporter [Sinorhizobium meliloti]MDW9593033.1 MFS transporter [Sinorhizobium meliloti]MDW9638761.1 MFS transporter [Sinorhizobium meliloti]
MHRSPSSLLSIASIVASMTSVAVGNGMMLAYVPFVLTRSAAPDWVPGAAVTAIAFGGLIGCLMGGSLIRRVGHARAFSCSMALVILAALMISLGVHPLLWVVARGLYGIAANMNFIITQSWLNHASENHWRGRAMALFYMAYVIGLGAGAWLFGQIPVEGNLAPIVTIFFTAVAILPIGLTRLPTPPAPARVSIDIPMVWRISPVAFIGVLASGGLSMLVQGFTPIYAAANSVSQKEVAALMFVMQFGLLFIQYPMGALSDRTDRRIVLIATCTLVIAAGIAALAVSFDNLLLLMLVFAMFAGAVETVYSIANAHANDRTDPADFVPLASTMLVAWSASATLVPMLVTLLTPAFGQRTFIYATMTVALLYALFVLVRLRSRERVPPDLCDSFEFKSAQVPNAVALAETEARAERPVRRPDL